MLKKSVDEREDLDESANNTYSITAPMVRSRLSRNLESQSKKQLIIFLVGIVIIIAIVISFGVYVIEGIGILASKVNPTEQNENQHVVLDTLQPPTFDSIPEAVKEETISISGQTSENNGSVELFINDKRNKVTDVEDGSFTFKNVKLNEGSNIIKSRQITESTKSEFSDEVRVQYVKEPPLLEISFPSDGSTLSRGDEEISVRGKTEYQNTVTVNAFIAVVDGEGNFSYRLKLSPGDNMIKVEATNPAGVKTTKELKVTYSP